MRFFARLLFLALPLLLVGCFFEKPLTSTPSEAINTWFLGEWQSKGADGGISRAVVTPAGPDRYSIQVTLAGNPSSEEYEFQGWASRVGDSTFLTLRNQRATAKTAEGSFVFFHPQMLDQNTIRLRSLKLSAAASATTVELRKEVRDRLKDGSLYSDDQMTDWTRVGEVYWQRDGKTGVFTPLRYQRPAEKSR